MREKSTKNAVFREVCKYIAYSHRHAELGTCPLVGYYGEEFKPGTPRFDMRGQPVAGTWRFAFAGWKGDLKARAETHMHARNYQATFICDQCCATQAFPKAPRVTLYTDFSAAALWRETILDAEAYVQTCTSPWATISGFRPELLHWDLMHIVYIGFARDVIGSMLGEFVLQGLLPAAPTETASLRLWWGGFRDWCKQNRIACPPGELTLSCVGWGKAKNVYPELLTRFKACSVKILVSYLAVYAERVCTGDRHSRVRTTCAWALADYCHTLDGASLVLRPREAERARHAGELFLTCFQYLSAEALDLKVRLWRIKPKTHYFAHVLDNLDDLPNPRHVECFTDESYLGCIKKLGQKCHAKSVSLRLLQRMILLLALRWHGVKENLPTAG